MSGRIPVMSQENIQKIYHYVNVPGCETMSRYIEQSKDVTRTNVDAYFALSWGAKSKQCQNNRPIR